MQYDMMQGDVRQLVIIVRGITTTIKVTLAVIVVVHGMFDRLIEVCMCV